jgi:DNA-binding NtrC family response regulator
MTRSRILIVDDKENILNLLRRILEDSYDVVTAADAERALADVSGAMPDLVISDMRMPGMDGLSLLQAFKRKEPEVEVILMTAYGTVQKAVQAMKAGAYDYLAKPFEPDEVLLTVARALERKQLRAQARNLRFALHAADRYDRLVGTSPAMRAAFGLLESAATSEASVLLVGEPGTGKSLAARAIHHASARQAYPLATVECKIGTELDIASALFGSNGGGLLGVAGGGERSAIRAGTVLLKDVDRLPLGLQAKLTQALERRRAPDAPSDDDAPVVRVISTTKEDLKAATAAGLFRADLYYLLNVIGVRLPPLRERKEDIPLLAAHFLETHSGKHSRASEGFTGDALEALVHYDWPGNVRELESAIERAVAVIDDDRIPVEALPNDVRLWNTGDRALANLAQLSYREAVDVARDRGTREYLIALMREFGGAVTKAAERAGVERESLHRLLKRHGLRSNEFKDD